MFIEGTKVIVILKHNLYETETKVFAGTVFDATNKVGLEISCDDDDFVRFFPWTSINGVVILYSKVKESDLEMKKNDVS